MIKAAKQHGVFLIHFTKKSNHYIAIDTYEGRVVLAGSRQWLLSELERIGVEVKHPDIEPVILGGRLELPANKNGYIFIPPFCIIKE